MLASAGVAYLRGICNKTRKFALVKHITPIVIFFSSLSGAFLTPVYVNYLLLRYIKGELKKCFAIKTIK